MKKLSIGIVGAGRIGNVHAESITYHIPQAQVAMVTDVIEESAKKLAERFGVPRYSNNYMDIINDPEIDAVLVCSPTPTHADITIAALKAGKHVFCEKPVHTSIEKIKEVAKVAQETGKKLQIGFNRRFDHNHRHVQQLAQNGSLGNIEIIKITSRDPEPPSPEYAASSGGLYIDMMIHDFDMAMFLAGSDVKEVYALGASLVDPRIGEAGDVDTAIVTLTFENGALGVKLACPDSEVYTFFGDGTYLMAHSELVTCLQEHLRVHFCLFDNSGWGCIENLQNNQGNDTFGTVFRFRDPETGELTGPAMPLDFAMSAAGYGLKAYSIHDEEGLRFALEDALRQDKPVLYDIKVAPGSMTPGYESWWRVGVAEVSAQPRVQAAYESLMDHVKDTRKF